VSRRRPQGPVSFQNRSDYDDREMRRLFPLLDWPDGVALLVGPVIHQHLPGPPRRPPREVGGIAMPLKSIRAWLQWGPEVVPGGEWLVGVCLLPEQEAFYGVERAYSRRHRAACWPRYTFGSWQERFVGVLGHELQHVRDRIAEGERTEPPTRYRRRQNELRAEAALVEALGRLRAAA
jgi:hypothetical protein